METDPESASIFVQLTVIAILTIINAFFAAAELAIVSINRTRLRILIDEGNSKAVLLQKLIKEPTKFLSTIQVGITFAGFFSSAYAATGIADDLGLLLSKFAIPYSQDLALIVVTLILSYVILVLGELYPKRLALQKSEAIALFAVKPVMFFLTLTAPFVKLLTFSTNLLIRLTGVNNPDLEERVSREEIKSMVEVGQEHGAINETEKEMIDSIFEFDDKLAEEVMTPRTDVYLIDIDEPLSEYVDELLQQKHSRIPVYEGDSDNIIGVLHIKDFIIEARRVGFANVDIRSILRPAYFVPERKNIDDLFKDLQNSKKQIAILIDEYGGFSGIVTIADVIEEVMGKIEDDDTLDSDADIKKIDDNTYLVKGRLPVEELNKELLLDLEDDSEDYDTLSGFLIMLLGFIPNDGEEYTLEHNNVVFKIEEVKNKRIEKVKICKIEYA
ncbi:Magnesium and cobalt efflux protein CorC [Sporotomaculum syntrophicum]|uniref:Magnesium and cobalt efflux protein CorC n=1 Tax=Sporotomaculum syntrophicum TaxID=182264 RepID=A0A9D2WSQ2_9FIRM|nr:hemolysin family protein [Sporotomaculum syntrophicum]KAF1086211.1 Magnesium and cobalt efflux protein CorC [Sporotomaculum syntrophicum]